MQSVNQKPHFADEATEDSEGILITLWTLSIPHIFLLYISWQSKGSKMFTLSGWMVSLTQWT